MSTSPVISKAASSPPPRSDGSGGAGDCHCAASATSSPRAVRGAARRKPVRVVQHHVRQQVREEHALRERAHPSARAQPLRASRHNRGLSSVRTCAVSRRICTSTQALARYNNEYTRTRPLRDTPMPQPVLHALYNVVVGAQCAQHRCHISRAGAPRRDGADVPHVEASLRQVRHAEAISATVACLLVAATASASPRPAATPTPACAHRTPAYLDSRRNGHD